jgi:6-phosphogluconolactonase (cycloisomerase 2 family)
MSRTMALYSAVDSVLTHHDLDLETAALSARAQVRLPAKLQYAWPHPTLPVFYTSSSDGGPRVPSTTDHVCAWTVAADGSLHPHGEPRTLPLRAVHMCADPGGRFVVNAHNLGTGRLTLHGLEADGRLGDAIAQAPGLDFGIYPHQVRVFPSGKTLLVVDRGNKANDTQPEDPGALRTFGVQGGVLSPGQVVAPQGGFGFGPRHAVFHPARRWMYVSDERMNKLYMFRFDAEDRLEAQPAWTLETLADPGQVRPRQIAGPIHMHPSGRFLYVANRADQTVEVNGARVFGGGENNIAVYRIDPETGEPTLMQHADTQSIHVRTFACDPSGQLLVTASIKPHARLEDGQVVPVPAALTIFRIDGDGRLHFVRRQAVETAPGTMLYWIGIAARPGA